MSGSTEIRAIPTVYRDIQFRSRHEADVAKYFDDTCLEWWYERKSFLLPGGVHFMPDFYLPDAHLWVEARGYSTAKGDLQIREFPHVMPAVDAFMVIWRTASGRRVELIPPEGDMYFQYAQQNTKVLVDHWAWELVGALADYFGEWEGRL